MKTQLLYLFLFLFATTGISQISFSPNLIDNDQATSNAANSVTAADFDNDGDIDIVGAAFQSDIFSLYRNDGSGNFTQETIDNSPTFSDGARFVTSFDLDEDGDMDVLATASTADVYLWFENDGTGLFTPHIIDSSALANEAYAIDAADFNNDGTMDIVGGANAGDALAVFNNDGNENFTLLTNLSANANLTDGVRVVKAADLNEDGFMDIVVAAFSGDTFSWFEGDGQGSFTPHPIDSSVNADGATGIQIADFDNDGDLDIAAASNSANQFLWYENDGDENFTTNIIDNTSPFTVGPRGVAIVDLEQDGDMDILGAAITGDAFTWYENDGNGNFTLALISDDVTYANGAFAITAADVDGDQVDDIITAANISDAFSWFKTEGVILANLENFLSGVAVFPNPTTHKITVQVPADTHLQSMQIIDMQGKIVFLDNSEHSEYVNINLEELASGVYYLSAETNKGNFTKKVIKL
tara:strand:- start:5688 stop:7100 length:1413 start_codon:yes stop_codon:yes gene_type:complete